MGLETWAYTLADADHYEPLDRHQDMSPPFRPANVPDGWTSTRQDVWLLWDQAGTVVPDQGWKIHVSTRMERAQSVLDVVGAICFADTVSFKHLATEKAFLYAHHKHATRAQSGKFCAIYPPDLATARRLLDLLADRLQDEPGPYILSDRRYRDSQVVHYRYGAFRSLLRAGPDGGAQNLVRDGSGALVEDHRTTRFVLPTGVTDPFQEVPQSPAPAADSGGATDDGIRLGRYVILRALSQSNAGGAYRARDAVSGRPVFIKEARAHNGLYWDRTTAQQRLRREHHVLRRLHELAPGLAPEPVDYFQEWEHEFLVTELVPGSTLADFVAQRNPLGRTGAPASEVTAYFDACRGQLRRLASALDRLHRLGYRFGDVNPMNVLVTPEGGLRLIDFEACGRLDEPPIQMGAPGFLPEREEDREGIKADVYGLSAIALSMIIPLHLVAERNPAMLGHLYADVSRCATVPTDLWELATRHVAAGPPATTATAFRPEGDPDGGCLPDPDEVAADPTTHLRWLRNAIGRDIAATATPEDPDRIYPTIPRGYLTNTLCVAYGTAGVLHTLHHARLPVEPAVVDRLRREALQRRDDLPPGLHTGTAGIAWVLAELGYLAEAADLVDAAGVHPATLVSCTWGEGSSGVGAARLALYAFTDEERYLDRAVALGQALCRTEDLTPLVGRRNAVGLLYGRAGVALFLFHLWRATGETRYLRHGTALLHSELDRAIEMPDGELGLPDNEVSRRAMTYLATGSAGLGHVLTRYVNATRDERLLVATPRVLAYVNKRISVEPGLYQGLAGMAFALADAADPALAGDPVHLDNAVATATALLKFAVPAADGRVRFLGEHSLRFSTELWSGSAGVLLALDRILNGPNGQFLALDGLLPCRESALVGHGAGRAGNVSDLAERR